MPRKQNKFANRSQVNGISVAVPLVSEQSASQIDEVRKPFVLDPFELATETVLSKRKLGAMSI